MKRKLVISLIIFLTAGYLYFYKLSKIPSGFYVDEASVAYNAFSILKTGKDEYGFNYPIYFRLMGSYTPSLFIYLSALLLNFFDMSTYLFRSISAISTLLSVYVFFKFSEKLKLYKLQITYFVITFFYAISPWLVFNARVGYETTLGFLVFTIGVYFLFLSYNKLNFLKWAVLYLSISTYIAHGQRFLAPLILLVYLLAFGKTFLTNKNKKFLLQSLFIGLALNIPNLLLITSRAFWIKSAQFNFNFFWNFLLFLSPKTLFYQNPDIDAQHLIPKISLYYNWMVIPYFVGLYLLIKKLDKYEYKFLALFSVVTLLPALFSSPFFSEQKVLPLIVPLTIIIGLGIDKIISKIGLLTILTRVLLVSAIAIYSLVILHSSYFVLFPKEMANGWHYGYEQIADFINENPDKKFLIDDTRNPRAYILLLYHLQVSPSKYHEELGDYYKDNYYVAPPPATKYKFANVQVRPLDWVTDPQKDLIIFGDPLTISEGQMKEHNLRKLSEITNPLSDPIFEIYITQPGYKEEN